jgi:hypothetical protein
LRPPLPDVFGLAIRLADVYGHGAHQDFLLASAGEGVVTRRLVRPTTGFDGVFSSLLPYEVGGRGGVIVGARARGGGTYEIVVARGAGGWRCVASLTLGKRLPAPSAAALRFDPWNSGGGVAPAGLVNRIRAPAYRGSRAGSAR